MELPKKEIGTLTEQITLKLDKETKENILKLDAQGIRVTELMRKAIKEKLNKVIEEEEWMKNPN